MARFPGGVHAHEYGTLTVKVESRAGAYVATVLRPSDGYEVSIETPERTIIGAARYALHLLAGAWRSGDGDPAMERAAREIGQDASEALAEIEISGLKMGADREEPQDSIMDMVNNIEGLYNDKNALYRKWIREVEDWSEASARREALALAAHFAEYLGSAYRRKDLKEAADEMVEEFKTEELPRWQDAPPPEKKPLPPLDAGDVEHAKKYDALARKIGIELVKALIPAKPERIRKALERGDDYLNTIPLHHWDAAAIRLGLRERGLSLSEGVSLLKHVAIWHYA